MNRICWTTTFSRKLASACCVVVNQVLVTLDTADFSVIIPRGFSPRERPTPPEFENKPNAEFRDHLLRFAGGN